MDSPFFERVKDLFMFREGSDSDSDSNEPQVTTGSIVWGLLLRSAIIIFISLFLIQDLAVRQYWWFLIFVFWFVVAYPAYRQFQKYHKRMEKFEEDTLCGSCINFDSSSQICRIFDVHVSRTFIPCEGQSWEPRHFDSDY